jgi:hypothetical protein
VKFLFAIDRRVQRWLRMCEQVSISCTQEIDNVLNFDNLIDQVLNGSFQMNLPASFKKIDYSPRNAPSIEPKQANVGRKGEGNGRNRKKRKNKEQKQKPSKELSTR